MLCSHSIESPRDLEDIKDFGLISLMGCHYQLKVKALVIRLKMIMGKVMLKS